MELKKNNNEVVLCCGRAKCPVLKDLDVDHVSISDDYGNTIKIRKDQASLITKALDILND